MRRSTAYGQQRRLLRRRDRGKYTGTVYNGRRTGEMVYGHSDDVYEEQGTRFTAWLGSKCCGKTARRDVRRRVAARQAARVRGWSTRTTATSTRGWVEGRSLVRHNEEARTRPSQRRPRRDRRLDDWTWTSRSWDARPREGGRTLARGKLRTAGASRTKARPSDANYTQTRLLRLSSNFGGLPGRAWLQNAPLLRRKTGGRAAPPTARPLRTINSILVDQIARSPKCSSRKRSSMRASPCRAIRRAIASSPRAPHRHRQPSTARRPRAGARRSSGWNHVG